MVEEITAITVGQLIEALEHCDPKVVVVSPHAMGDGFEDVVKLTPVELIARSDEEIAKEYKEGRPLSRYRAGLPGESPVMTGVAIELGRPPNASCSDPS